MPMPEILPIRHEPDHRTETIGRHRGGQFFGYATGVRGSDRFYAVLHLFDHDGTHLHTRVWPTAADRSEDPRVDEVLAKLEDWLTALPGREYGDIAVRRFEETIDGQQFGLVAESHGDYPEGAEEDDWIELYPAGLGFHAPWDGHYDT
ncbi:hypothetical protein [Streptacidiphilus sp. PAMC 29251]